jgi:hypothetical protein
MGVHVPYHKLSAGDMRRAPCNPSSSSSMGRVFTHRRVHHVFTSYERLCEHHDGGARLPGAGAECRFRMECSSQAQLQFQTWLLFG